VNHAIGAGWTVLDVLGGLIPLIVDAATCSWNQLENTTVRCLLEIAEVPALQTIATPSHWFRH
jgi:hypothetical protein